MMKVLLCAALLAISVHCVMADGRVDEFKRFCQTFNRNYTGAEWQTRFLIYAHNKDTIDRLNAQELVAGNKQAPFGENEFTDVAEAEFAKMYLGYRPVPVEAGVFDEPRVSAPSEFSWKSKGAVTPVKNQEQCGSCWAFSVTEEVESCWHLAGNPLIELSVQQIVSCDHNDLGCNGGDPPTAYQYIMNAGGLDLSKDYPYTSGGGNNGQCHFKKSGVAAHISGFKYATQDNDEQAMQQVVATTAPLSICVDASTWQFYTGGIITSACGTQLDHCVQATGYGSDNGVPYWEVRNSWGSSWGESGYLRVERNKDLCGIAQEATYVII